MKQPWDLDDDWVATGEEYYNVTQGDPGWADYAGTVFAFNRNSFEVPCLAGFIILGTFGILVLLAAARNVAHIYGSSRRQGYAPMRKFLTQSATFGRHHATPYETLGGWISIKAPLRGQTCLILLLIICNILPIATIYSPYEPNLYWPDGHYDQMLRYLADRSGVLATAQLPPVILLSGRNNPVTFLTGASFSTCMLYHRWFARVIFVQAVVHAVAYSVIEARYGLEYYRELFLDPYIQWGVVSTAGMGLGTFLSLRYLRNKAYEIFVVTHIIFAVLALVGLYYHIALIDYSPYADFINCIWASVFFWAFDRVARLLRIQFLNFRWSTGLQTEASRFSTARVRFLENSTNILAIEVQLQGPARRLISSAAGRFVQIWLPRVQPISSHPFTVTQVNTMQGTTSLLLYVRVYDGITRRLAKKVQQSGEAGKCDLVALVEGPYGAKVHLDSKPHALLIAGGVGITAILPYFKERFLTGSSVELVWLVRDMNIVQMLIECFGNDPSAISRQTKSDDTEKADFGLHRLAIYLTGSYHNDAIESANPMQEQPVLLSSVSSADASGTVDSIQPCKDQMTGTADKFTCDNKTANLKEFCSMWGIELTIHSQQGRPCIGNVLETMVATSACSQPTVVACGPTALCDDIRQFTVEKDIEYHEEAFNW